MLKEFPMYLGWFPETKFEKTKSEIASSHHSRRVLL